MKQNYFAFCCENSISARSTAVQKNETVQTHGFGLKIIRSLTEQYGGLSDIEQTDTTYQIRIILPLR